MDALSLVLPHFPHFFAPGMNLTSFADQAADTSFSFAGRSLVLTAIESIVRELAAEFHGIIWDGSAHTGSFVTRFSEASKAVSFALKLRRALVDVTWTEEVLALRGCGPEPMQLSFQRAKGPQLQTLITLVCAWLAPCAPPVSTSGVKFSVRYPWIPGFQAP